LRSMHRRWGRPLAATMNPVNRSMFSAAMSMIVLRHRRESNRVRCSKGLCSLFKHVCRIVSEAAARLRLLAHRINGGRPIHPDPSSVEKLYSAPRNSRRGNFDPAITVTDGWRSTWRADLINLVAGALGALARARPSPTFDSGRLANVSGLVAWGPRTGRHTLLLAVRYAARMRVIERVSLIVSPAVPPRRVAAPSPARQLIAADQEQRLLDGRPATSKSA